MWQRYVCGGAGIVTVILNTRREKTISTRETIGSGCKSEVVNVYPLRVEL